MRPDQFREQMTQLTMPLDDAAQFDGRPAGWLVCPPGSAHRSTVTGGRALVSYLLPQASTAVLEHLQTPAA